ncbi:PD40 domain-containing protein [Catellatospora vulcania]|uniref:PD40 domain-containing protein n=1 Tax=Catellatospora vulcania TaxID=1460450 RepID=UPI0012D41E99|nr:PD40 domain-containing protein [Catellatospora vulcania]
MRRMRKFAVGLCLVAATVAVPVSPAAAVDPGVPGKVAFIRGGNLFVAEAGGTVWQVTTGGGYEWPRWRPNTDDLAVIKNGNLFLGHYTASSHSFATTLQITSSGSIGAGAWSPDGNRLAYAYGTLPYSPTIYIAELGSSPALAKGAATVTTTKVDSRLSPAAQAEADRLPKKAQRPAVAAAAAPAWHPTKNSLAVAWSPDGRYIAYPNGECFAVYDECLSLLDTTDWTEIWFTGFGGGGSLLSGFATVPAFTADSSRVMWNEQTIPRMEPNPQLGWVHINSAPISAPNNQTRVGVDTEYNAVPSPANNADVLVTGGRNGVAWIARRNGPTRTWLYQGYHQDWQAL